ncbi:hypothetical protein V9T40_006411 [Parthenolecanium corni]|uniref:Gamma-tubulin complex component n=1 Tax=Parthenolecanium corni TaxID=536013 RepID=A0AAN9Y7M1_9HEMI
MLHEVIVTLSGFSGKLLNNVDGCLELKNFLHPAERSLLQNILAIAENYRFIKDFINANHAAIFGVSENKLQTAPGQYIQAFCEGLDDVLKPYRQEIIRLEENILIGPEVTLIYIFSRVDKYSSLFTLLTSLLNEIISRKIHGCQILQLLYENIIIAVDQAKDCLECLLNRCHTVFLEQTSTWLMNGFLVDTFGEYVIRKSARKDDTNEESDSSILSAYRDGFSEENIMAGGYEIAIDFIPFYINYSLVNDILFVGQIVGILNENPRNNSDEDIFSGNLIFGDKEKMFFEKFTTLKASISTDMEELKNVVLDIRECVVHHLWKVAVEEENLYKELSLLKNFYLLGFGPFFKDFLLEASALSLHTVRKHFSHDLNDTLRGVACSYPHMDEKTLSKFNFKIETAQLKESSKTTDSIWSSIKLQYTAKWPLNLIFTPVAIEHYNKLFLFLLRIKRCQIGIHEVWKNDIKNKSVRCEKVWKLRNELMFLINNLQFYLQVDVIETEYCNLINEIHKVKDFQQIEKLHNIFLLNVLSHSFLLQVPADNANNNAAVPSAYPEYFYSALLNNIKICEKFCFLASQGSLNNKSKEIIKLDKSFQKYKTIVLCFLSEYQSQPFKQHLVKLLLRLNFNQWVGKHLLKAPE